MFICFCVQSMEKKTFFTQLDKLPKKLILAVTLITIPIFGFIDLLTGIEISFSVFYFLPIALGTWIGEKKWGISLSFLSSVTWFMADKLGGHIYSSPIIIYWNAFMRFSVFCILIFLLVGLKNYLKRLAEKEAVIKTSQKITAMLAESIAAQNMEIIGWIQNRKSTGHQVSEKLETASTQISSCLHILSQVSFMNPYHPGTKNDDLLSTLENSLRKINNGGSKTD